MFCFFHYGSLNTISIQQGHLFSYLDTITKVYGLHGYGFAYVYEVLFPEVSSCIITMITNHLVVIMVIVKVIQSIEKYDGEGGSENMKDVREQCDGNRDDSEHIESTKGLQLVGKMAKLSVNMMMLLKQTNL